MEEEADEDDELANEEEVGGKNRVRQGRGEEEQEDQNVRNRGEGEQKRYR